MKKYWDLLSGSLTGLILSAIAKFQLEQVQLIYSVIILVLVSIGVFKIIRQAVEKRGKKRNTALDKLADSQKPVKAINLALEPTHEGEELGALIIDILKGATTMEKNDKFKIFWDKCKVFFDKFKGYMLAIALAVLTLVEMYGGYINELFGGNLTICGYEVIPKITMLAAIIVGCASNGFTKEQWAKIKSLFSTKNGASALVQNETKKTIKATKDTLNAKMKEKAALDKELLELKDQLQQAQDTLTAKTQMQKMMPTLVSDADIEAINTNINNLTETIKSKQVEVDEAQAHINNLNTTIAALNTALKSIS